MQMDQLIPLSSAGEWCVCSIQRILTSPSNSVCCSVLFILFLHPRLNCFSSCFQLKRSSVDWVPVHRYFLAANPFTDEPRRVLLHMLSRPPVVLVVVSALYLQHQIFFLSFPHFWSLFANFHTRAPWTDGTGFSNVPYKITSFVDKYHSETGTINWNFLFFPLRNTAQKHTVTDFPFHFFRLMIFIHFNCTRSSLVTSLCHFHLIQYQH